MMRRLSLKSMINGIILIIALIAFSVNSIAVGHTWKNLKDIRQQNIKTISYQLEKYLTAENDKLFRIQQNLISQVCEDGFFELLKSDNAEHIRKNLSEYIYRMQDINSNPIYALAVNSDGDYCIITETVLREEIEEMKKIVKDYGFDEPEDENREFEYEYFLINKPNYTQNIYICCYAPVYDYDFSIGKKYFAGNILVCTKVSIEKLLFEYEEWSNIDVSLKKGDRTLKVLAAERVGGSRGFNIDSIKIKNTSWSIEGIIYESKLEKKLFNLILLMLLGIFSIVVLMIIFHKFMNHIINRPVRAIVDYLNGRADGNERQRLEIKESTEFSDIAESINKMIKADHEKTKYIFFQQQRLYEYELQTKEALLNNLQRQINPHFLYNTLECVRTLALINDAKEIADIAVDIAEIMRYSLSMVEDVTLDDEVSAIKHYLSIMEARYPGRFRCNIDIPEKLLGCTVMKMILQPILENAFKHGLKMTKNGNVIDIKGKEKENDIYITVRDNGKGIGEKELELLKNRLDTEYSEQDNKIGILNVHHRLKLHYGESYGIDVESKLGEYTAVILKIPSNEDKNKNM